jgi:hypothetical protein
MRICSRISGVELRPAIIATGSAGMRKVRQKVTIVTPTRMRAEAESRRAR